MSRRGAGGFTLIEMVLVATLLGTLVGLSAPSFRRSFRELGLNVGAWMLSSSLTYARERAVMDRSPVRVLLDETEGTWRLSSLDPATGTFEERADRWARPRRLPQGLALKSGTPHVTFYPDGTAEAGSVDLLSAGEGGRRIKVDPLLGRVATEELREGQR
jgi:Tfp pilus assembly protein FimT